MPSGVEAGDSALNAPEVAAGPEPNGEALLGVASLKLKDEDLETLKKAYSK